jgi:hypothetical protein
MLTNVLGSHDAGWLNNPERWWGDKASRKTERRNPTRKNTAKKIKKPENFQKFDLSRRHPIQNRDILQT